VPYSLKIPAADTNEENGAVVGNYAAVRGRFSLTSAVINFGRLVAGRWEGEGVCGEGSAINSLELNGDRSPTEIALSAQR